MIAVHAQPAASAVQSEDGSSVLELESPREAMRQFLDNLVAYKNHGHSRFLTAGVQAFEGDDPGAGKLAQTLYAALNRVEFVDYDSIPGVTEIPDDEPSLNLAFGPPPSDPAAIVEVLFVRVDPGGWRISGETLASAPEVWARVKDLPLIDDLPLLDRVHVRIRGALPPAFSARVFILEGWQWVGLLVLAFLSTVLDRIARVISGILLRRLARGETLDDDSVAGFGRPIGLLFAALVFAGGLPVLDLEPQILSILDIAAAFVAAVAGVWAAYRLVDVFCDYLASRAAATDTKFDDVLVPLLRRTLKLFVAILGGVYLASRLTTDLWGIVAGLGVGSIAVAFAGRDTIENLFGTFTVLLDKPFELGDWIIVDDNEGSVEEVGFRSTRIRTFYNSVITVPNRTFVTADVDNMGRRRYRRIKTMLAVTYDTPPEKIEAFCAGIRRIIDQHPYTRKDYYHVYLNGLGASSLDVLLYAFLECPDWGTELREKHRLFADILRLAEKLEVGFAFPTQTLHVAKPEDLEHPDRPASDGEGATHGAGIADQILAESLRPFGGPGAKPPPVVTLDDPHARRGSEAEAGE